VETFSDVPIRFSKGIRQRLLQYPKAAKKGFPAVLSLLKGLGDTCLYKFISIEMND